MHEYSVVQALVTKVEAEAARAGALQVHGVQVALGDLPHGSLGYQTIFAAGLMLMLLTLFFNLVGYWMRRRFREAY